jgi:hypothetical protein
MAGVGIFMGGAADNRAVRQRNELDARRVDLAEAELGLRQEQAGLKVLSEALTTTRSEIDGLITIAREAKAKGASPDQLRPVRRLIETMGAQLGVATPGVPLPRGATSVPGGEALIQSGLNRFDALVGATPVAPGPKGLNTIERIREKIASGEQVTPGEQKVYDDALRADPLARLLAGAQQAAPATPTIPVVPPAAGTQSFASAEEVRAAVKAGKVQSGEVVTVNGKPMRVGK